MQDSAINHLRRAKRGFNPVIRSYRARYERKRSPRIPEHAAMRHFLRVQLWHDRIAKSDNIISLFLLLSPGWLFSS